ncbi:MAG: hypothetical protein AVDCRST_MAG66-2487, partial [uncultured Pseudonocardia sp.]
APPRSIRGTTSSRPRPSRSTNGAAAAPGHQWPVRAGGRAV